MGQASKPVGAFFSILLNAKADLSCNMTLRFEKAFGVDMETLMPMQNSYDIAQTRSRARKIRVGRYQPRPAAKPRVSGRNQASLPCHKGKFRDSLK